MGGTRSTFLNGNLLWVRFVASEHGAIPNAARMSGTEFPGLERYRIDCFPEGLYYIPNFLSPEEGSSLLEKVSLCLRGAELKIPSKRWTELAHRRLQAHPSQLTKKQSLIGSPLAEWLQYPCIDRMRELGIWKSAPHQAANHCLINQSVHHSLVC
jgi:alkylated DNA repair protein alkB family protein 6